MEPTSGGQMPGNLGQYGRAALLLAGGDGVRMRRLTRFLTGLEIPKQFCAITGAHTWLEETRERIAHSISAAQSFIVVNLEHRSFYESLVGDLPRSHIVAQPGNRGTGAAILYGLRRILALNQDSTAQDSMVAIFPTDHFVGDQARFMRHVEQAFAALERHPTLAIILGIVPAAAETSYGWIEPASLVTPSTPGLFHVRRFWEKPGHELALQLLAGGSLWNSFVIIARASVLHSMIAAHAPALVAEFDRGLPLKAAVESPQAAETVYRRIESVDFSAQVLAQCPSRLAVQRVDDVEWSDLGEPERLIATLERLHQRPVWAGRFAAYCAPAAAALRNR